MNRMILIPLSVLACGVMLIAISYAFSVFRAPVAAAPVTTAEQIPFTPENPAYHLPRVASLGGISGPVSAITKSGITIGTGEGMEIIRISSETKVYQKGGAKDEQAYQEELAAFRALVVQAGGTDEIFIAPDRFETTPLSLEDIDVGDVVEIRTEGTTVGVSEPHAITIFRITATQ